MQQLPAKAILFACITLLGNSTNLSAQSFVPLDVLVSAPDAQIGDPEFDPIKKRICWQSLVANELWICDLDTLTWQLAVPDGEQLLVDVDLAPLAQTFNAGEWAFGQAGASVVYTKLIGNAPYIAIASENGGSWALNTLLDRPNRFNPRATKLVSDPVPSIQYVTFPGTGTTKYKFFDALSTELSVPNFSDAHWADDEQVLTGILTNDQVGLFDPASPGTPSQLTFDAGTVYSRPYMWRAPEHGGARMFFAKANGSGIRVFKETSPGSNNYTPYLAFNSPSADPAFDNIGSPEPIVYQGQSYITFMASTSPLETDGALAEIWIAKVDSLLPEYRMVSDTTSRVRTDPEPFPTDGQLFMFYTEVNDSIDPGSYGTLDATTILRLRRCDTGYGVETSVPDGSVFSAEHRAYPNPFDRSVQLAGSTRREFAVLQDAWGRNLYQGFDLSRQDLSSLAPGLYVLRTGAYGSQTLIKQ